MADNVMMDAAVPFQLLQSYIGLTDSYEKSIVNAKTVKRINETLACNNDYCSHLLELERAVRSVELLAEKQVMLSNPNKSSPAGKTVMSKGGPQFKMTSRAQQQHSGSGTSPSSRGLSPLRGTTTKGTNK